MTENQYNLFGNPRIKRVHFIGIGGAGMNVLARIILALGFKVSGSDLRKNEITQRLSSAGADIFQGHREEQVDRADLIVYSSAVNPDNPELTAGRRSGIDVVHRSELLAELMKWKKGIAVAGSHGKTSTSAMIAWILLASGYSPALALGGEVIGLEENEGWGEGEYLVAEADESDGSLSRLEPEVEVITGLDLDHVDYYSSWERVIETFGEFVNRLPDDGVLIIEAGTPDLNRISRDAAQVVTYGLSPSAQVRAGGIRFDRGGSRFTVFQDNDELGEVVLGRPGTCNITNSLGAIACSLKLGVGFGEITSALRNFRGVRRRLEIKTENPVMIVEDYAHHPVEVSAALEAIRLTRPGKLWCVFQPHRYSRTRHFYRELAEALLAADRIIITDLYPAFEKPLPGVSSALLLDALREMDRPDVLLLEQSSIRPYLERELISGDAVIIMGAGDIGRLAGELSREYIHEN